MWRVFAIAAALILAAPSAASASTGAEVSARCAATAWDAATCGKLAQIADALVASDDVSDDLARDVDALPVEQRVWLADTLDALSRQADDGETEIGDGETGDGFSTMSVPDAEGRPRRPRNNPLAHGLRKARDFIRSRLR